MHLRILIAGGPTAASLTANRLQRPYGDSYVVSVISTTLKGASVLRDALASFDRGRIEHVTSLDDAYTPKEGQ